MIKQFLTPDQSWMINNWQYIASVLEDRDPNSVVRAVNLPSRIPPMFFSGRPKFTIRHYSTDDKFCQADIQEDIVPGEGIDILGLKKKMSSNPVPLLWSNRLVRRGIREFNSTNVVYGGSLLRHTVPTPEIKSDVIRFFDWILEGKHGSVFCPRLVANSGFYRWNNYIGVLPAYTYGESIYDDSDLVKPTHIAYRRIDFLKFVNQEYQRILRLTVPRPNRFSKCLEIRSLIGYL